MNRERKKERENEEKTDDGHTLLYREKTEVCSLSDRGPSPGEKQENNINYRSLTKFSAGQEAQLRKSGRTGTDKRDGTEC